MKKLISITSNNFDQMAKTPSTNASREIDSRWSTTAELEGPLTCVAGNATCSHLVVGGRNVFKIFDVGDVELVEVVNLRYGANLSNLTYSVYDIGWSPLDDSLIASATPNGAIVLWDVNARDNPKSTYWNFSQGHIFHENKRIVNRVVFHPADASIIISGSQDGSVKLFDVRTKELKLNFSGSNDSSIRDIQFEQNFPNVLAAGADNGTVQIWDVRNTSKCENIVQAHHGPCFTLDWHPEERWLATGGRDRTIKVWDFNSSLATRVPSSYCAYTIASTARIRWRPLNKFQLISSASIVEFGVNIWDVRQPYLPIVYSGRHMDVVTGITWKTNDANVFYTTGKDCRLCRNLFSEGQNLERNANPVTMNISANGSIASAVSSRILDSDSKSSPPGHSPLPMYFQKLPDRISEETAMLYCKSLLSEFTNVHDLMSMDYFVEMAKNYKLCGAPFPDICDNNAAIAERLGRSDVAQVWLMLKLMFPTDGVLALCRDSLSDGNSVDVVAGQGVSKEIISAANVAPSSKRNSFVEQGQSLSKKNAVSTGLSDEDSDRDEIFHDSSNCRYLNAFENEMSSNFYESFADFDDISDTYQDKKNLILPQEGVQVIEPLDDQIGVNIFSHFANETWSANNSAQEDSESSSTMVTRRVDVEEAIKHEILNIAPFRSTLPAFDYTKTVIDALKYYADQNDVQTVVTVIVVLGDRIRPFLEADALDQWFTSYIDLLGHFELWSIATEVIKLSQVITQMSTAIKTSCRRCSRSLAKSKWKCDRCENSVHRCIICHLPVKGLYIWCQGCAHGGHIAHIRTWFSEHRECPTGCGHLCEFN